MRSIIALILLPGLAAAQSVKLPSEVKADPGVFAVVKSETDCPTLRWVSLDGGLSLLPPELLKDSRTAVVMAGKPGRYRLLAYGAMKDAPSEPAVCTVVVGEAPPVPPPGPGPKPPEPKPSGGFDRVLILYETSELGKMPAAQDAILTSRTIHDYLKGKTLKDTDNPNGAWRIWDKDVNATNESKPWQDLLARPRTSVPWIILSGSGGIVHEGPLPANVQATLDLLAKFAPQTRKVG